MAVQAPDASSFFRDGYYLDALDSSQKWLVAFVMQTDPAKGVLVRFDGWSKKWNEWLSLKSYRVAPFRKHAMLYTGQQANALRDWTYQREEVLNRLDELLRGVKSIPSPYDITQFYRGHLFMLVDNLLANSPPSEELPHIVEFLNEVLRFAISWLRTLPERFAAVYQGLANPEAYLSDRDVAYAFIWPELFFTLERLFGCDPRLQELFTVRVPDSVQLRTLSTIDVPFLLQQHFIALFIESEGFKLLTDLLQHDDLPLQLIPPLPIWAVATKLLPEFRTQLEQLISAVLSRLNRFSEKDQRNYDKVCMQTLMKNLTDVALSASRDMDLISKLEDAEMTIGLQLLKSKFLDKRVRGINNITESLIRVSPHVSDRFRSVTPQAMIEWLRSNQVVQIILTDRPHIEILKRSQQLFAFLAEKERISTDDLEALWASLPDKHESFARTVYELIAGLAQSLSPELLNFIYRRLQTIDITRSPDYVIDGMMQFTLAACTSARRVAGDLQSYCLREFVGVLSRAPESPQAVQVSQCVTELLRHYQLRSFRTSTLDSLRAAGRQAAGLIGKLLADLPDDFSRMYLQQNGPDLLRNVTPWVADAVQAKSSVRELRELLELLELIASKGSYACRLSEEGMKSLWAVFVGHLEYSEAFFGWLQAALVKRADFLIDSDFAFSVFSSLLCNLSSATVEKLGLTAFACFQQFFLFSNSTGVKYREDFVVERTEETLQGLETLIAFVLHTKDDSVLQRALRLFSQLYLRIVSSPHNLIFSNFVTDLLRELQKFAAKGDDQLIDRSLRILTGLVEAYDYLKLPRAVRTNYQDWQTVYYRLSTDTTWKNIVLSKKDTLGTLRRGISYVNQYPPDCVNLGSSQQAYTFIDDERVLGSLGHPLHFIVTIEQHNYSLQDVTEVLGQDEEAQSLLFSLLSARKGYQDKVWQLLSRLPSNKSIQQRVRELGVTFKDLVHSSSFHEQLFCLLVLQQLNRTSPGFKDVMKRHWPNELLLVLKRLAPEAELVTYFDAFESSLVLRYAQLMLQLNYEFCDRSAGNLSKTEAVPMVLDLLCVYAKNVQDTSEMASPTVPAAAWQIILEFVGQSDYDDLRKLLVNFKNFDDLIFYSLQRARNSFFSFHMKDFFHYASLPPLALLPILSEKLIGVIPKAVDSTETTRAYFSLTAKLIKLQEGAHNETYFQVLFDFLQRRNPEPHPKAEDRGLSGALKLLKAMVSKTPSLASLEVAEYVLLTCLIDFEETHESRSRKPKCKSEKTREAAFKLLVALTQQPEVRTFVLSMLSNFHCDTSWRKGKLLCWLNAYNTFEKSATGFVGLRNLGCTCYMNSMLQQLFMIKSFREGLFQCESTGEHEESVLFQLQKIMAGLERSDKMFVQARGLCAAYVNWEGQPINPNEQIDVDEFFNGLMDKVEDNLKPTVRSKLVEEHFRGIMTTQCIGRGNCTHISERDEPFMTLPVETKNRKCIFDSLEALTAGETLEGDNAYACDYCATKVTARRRLCIRSLPNYLILTLRRFDFDLDTMNRVKLNNYCEFPLDLDMKPYTIEAVQLRDALAAQEEARAQGREPLPLPAQAVIPSEYFQYKLRGVVIHMGLAEAGHYYSYIFDSDSKKWIEFNDANVDEFDIENLANEAFGTLDKPMGGMQGEEAGKMRNAYVLLYERSTKYELKGKDDQIPTQQLRPEIDAEQAPSVKELLERVHRSNQRYWRKRRVFSPEYSHFVSALSSSPGPEVLGFVVRHYFTTQIRSKEHEPQLMRFVYEKAPADTRMAQWLLEMISFEPMLKELFFDCPQTDPKKFVAAVADRCLRNVDETQQLRFLRRLLSVLPKLPAKLTTQHSGFFELIYRVVLVRPEAASEVDLCRKLLALVFALDIPLEEPQEESELANIGLGRENELVTKFSTPPGAQALSYSFQIATVQRSLDHLSPDLLALLKEPAKIAALVKGANGRFGANCMSRLYRALIATDPSVFPCYLQALLAELRNNDYDQHKSPLIQLKRLIAQNAYTGQIMKEVCQILVSNMMYIRATESLVTFLYKLVSRYPTVRAWMETNVQMLAGLSMWRQRYFTWNNQSTNGLYLTKVYNPSSQFIDYHPSALVSSRVVALLGGKVPDADREFDSDDDFYDEPLEAKSRAEVLFKEESCYRVEVLDNFRTLYYVKMENMEHLPAMFLSADDDRLLKPGTRIKSVVIK